MVDEAVGSFSSCTYFGPRILVSCPGVRKTLQRQRFGGGER